MAKETMSERNSNPAYFERIECEAEGCKSTENLLKHRYAETYCCVSCANKLATKLREEKEREIEELYGPHESFRKDMALSDLISEREA